MAYAVKTRRNFSPSSPVFPDNNSNKRSAISRLTTFSKGRFSYGEYHRRLRHPLHPRRGLPGPAYRVVAVVPGNRRASAPTPGSHALALFLVGRRADSNIVSSDWGIARIALWPGQVHGLGAGRHCLGVQRIGCGGPGKQDGRPPRRPRECGLTPAGAFVRGAIALELAAVFPFIGWFLLIPLTIVTSLGATAFALLHWMPRAIPLPEGDREATPPEQRGGEGAGLRASA